MRSFSTAALFLSFLALTGTASAKQPRATKGNSAAVSSPETPRSLGQPTPARNTEASLFSLAPSAAEPSAPATATGQAYVDRASEADTVAAIADAAARPVSVAPLLGVASGGLRFGAGIRAGYTLPSHVYLGAGFMYHSGLSTEFYNTKISSSAYYPSLEAGVDIRFGRLAFRPYGGIAVVFSRISSTIAGNEVSSTGSSPAIYPGCAVTYDIPKSSVFVGGDARLVLNFDQGSSFGVFGSAGMRF